MTKADLVRILYQEHGALNRAEAAVAVDQIMAVIKSRVAAGGRVLITNFGSFAVTARKPRRGRNPVTGEITQIQPRRTLVFRASRGLEERLNRSRPDRPALPRP